HGYDAERDYLRRGAERRRDELERQRADGEVRRKLAEINRVAATEFDRGRESGPERERRAKFELDERIGFHPLDDADRERLAPPADDAARYAGFLSQPGTGLVRLLPRDPKDFNGQLSVRGGGAYYSFAHLIHEYNYGSDIGLERGDFLTGFAGAGYGFLLDLGDVPVEGVALEAEPVASLASFEPPVREAEARRIQSQLHGGYRVGETVYRWRGVPAVAGHTYLLRSVDYRRSDVLVVFRVLRRDEETGDVILLWRMLKRFPAPPLAPTVGPKD
ncbi:MAG: hypothetical protein M3348_08340, partial [Acidobacteriota bacterium]|nr:hypothetical protein [Acidobacteriota bacterium]